MADAAPSSGGALRGVVLWLLVLALLGAVWWLASERNQRRWALTTQNGTLVVERGRYFPIGAVAQRDKPYDPVPLPAGAKAPGELEFDDQAALDRTLDDLYTSWAREAEKHGDMKSAAALVDRASQLPALTASQLADLTKLRADFAWDEAQADVQSALQTLAAARAKLELVKQAAGAHAADAAALQQKLGATEHDLSSVSR